MKRGMSAHPSGFSYNIHNLLRISSYSPNFIPNYFLTNTKCNKPDIIIRSRKEEETVSSKDFTQIAPGLYYNENERLVNSSIRIFGITASWSLKRLWEKTTEISFSRGYEILSKTLLRMPISTVFPLQAYIQHVLHAKLLCNNHTFLVGGCFETRSSDLAIVLSSMGGMGKTTLILKALKDIGGKYLGDDMTIIDRKGIIYAYPKPIRLRKFNILPIFNESHVPPPQILGSRSQIKQKSKVGVVCLLERNGQGGVKPVEPEKALAKLLIINRKLLPYYMERTILAHSYMGGSLRLYELMRKETGILRDFLKHADCYTLKCKHNDFACYIKSLRSINEYV